MTFPEHDYHDGSGYDRETVRFFDVAHEGAQIRSVAGVIEQLLRLRGTRPRSVVVLATDHLPRACARFVVAEYAPLRVPVIVTDQLPTYFGALDVLVALTDRGDDPVVARALINADNRGADTVLAGPARGPLLEDTPSGTISIPALPTVAGFSPARAIATITAVLDVLENGDVPVEDRLYNLADNVDVEIESLSPERDETVNPGRQVRAHVEGARTLHAGEPGLGANVAELASTLFSADGLASGFADFADFPAALGDNLTESSNDIFHDPFLDGPQSLLPLKVIVWDSAETTLANALPITVGTAVPSQGRLDTALRLITRALAVPTYSAPEEPGT